MSLYANYLKERTNDHIIETEDGFATYRYINDKTVYIMDIYTLPEKRRSNLASNLADQIALEAKSKGCTEMLGTVVPSTKNADSSIKVLQGYGMKLDSCTNDLIVFKKDL